MPAGGSTPISGLPPAGSAIDPDYFVIVHGGVTKRLTAEQAASYIITFFGMGAIVDGMDAWEATLPADPAGLAIGDWWSNSGSPTRVKSL